MSATLCKLATSYMIFELVNKRKSQLFSYDTEPRAAVNHEVMTVRNADQVKTHKYNPWTFGFLRAICFVIT